MSLAASGIDTTHRPERETGWATGIGPVADRGARTALSTADEPPTRGADDGEADEHEQDRRGRSGHERDATLERA